MNPITGNNANDNPNSPKAITNVKVGFANARCIILEYVALIPFCRVLRKILPSGLACFFNNALPKNGTTVSETNKDAKTLVITASGNPRTNSPGPPGRKINGKKEMINVAVQPTTAKLICLVAFIEASFGL